MRLLLQIGGICGALGRQLVVQEKDAGEKSRYRMEERGTAVFQERDSREKGRYRMEERGTAVFQEKDAGEKGRYRIECYRIIYRKVTIAWKGQHRVERSLSYTRVTIV
jgi:hypothetical protein